MSEIQRYMYARDGMVPDAEHLRGSGEPEFWVRFTDHEAAIALRTRVCAEAFEDELARTEERVLADAKARIEEINIEHHVMPHRHDDYALFEVALNCALAALTQPQTEKCPQCGGDGKGPLTHHFGEPCPTCDGGGAATPRGVADADLVRVGDFFGIPAFTHPDVKPGIVGIVSAGEVTAVIADREEPGPYAKAFRERVCPVPEFPGIEKEES